MPMPGAFRRCGACFRRCGLSEGETGFCRARINRAGEIVPKHYGIASSVALDPIEKKPLVRFFPGSLILSIGSFGCNMRCPFCQNHEISQAGFDEEGLPAGKRSAAFYLSPEAAASKAFALRDRGNIGLAFTYNEPLVSWEYVRDAARIAKEECGLKSVVVTNGCVLPAVWESVLPFIDAVNIDCKCFSEEGYRSLGGDLESALESIRICAAQVHTEVTTLVVPGLNDSEGEIENIARFLSSTDSCDGEIVLHLTRFFPRYRATHLLPTDKALLFRLSEIARRHIPYVLVGNC